MRTLPVIEISVLSPSNLYSRKLEEKNKNSSHAIIMDLIAKELKVSGIFVLRTSYQFFLVDSIKDFELSVVDTQKSTIGGVYNEFIFSPRLDNLLMSFCSLRV